MLWRENQQVRVIAATWPEKHSWSSRVTPRLLADNPWSCDCDLQRVFRKLRSIQRLFLYDYYNLSCKEPPELQGYRLTEVDAELCIAETVTVLIITVTVLMTVVAAIIITEKKDTVLH
ncbi:hypothetical protein AAFF_G00006970 [Aldrovandia affinis]|uniref:LRRCT domain-containing protein n=1 Tax=Aldrovandia affinis TaxID=143900 RepID=A0AAD7T5W8_9TELE|nr:hypothetical protein AAFF_G00006970 [Aldrovandia affinis]